jgi:Flp pilus assembly protein TadD
VAERLRYLAGAESLRSAGPDGLRERCRASWQARGLLTDASAPLDPAAEERVRDDLLDLALLWSDLERRLGSQEDMRAVLPGDLPRPAPRASWEHVALGRSLLRSGELARAAEELGRAADLRPQDFWAHFYLGVCDYRRRDYGGAVHAFDVALALAPESAECYGNRGLAYSAWGKNERARADYDRALALDPRAAAARLNRAVLDYQEGRLADAADDLGRALLDGADPVTAHYNLALVRLAQRDEEAARRELDRALADEPAHAEARALRERLSSQSP